MNAVKFREAMAALPEPPATSAPPWWDFWRHDLWDRAQADDAANFMKWPAVYATMLVNHFPIGHQLLYLQEDWERWERVVSDPTSESNQRNLINQAYHLKLWEDTTGRRVRELHSIFEFGGGYGAMALVAQRAGFRGVYAIHDLPEFALLQDWWLGNQPEAVPVTHLPGPVEADLFIAIYSISETPPAERDRWLKAESYLMLCSSQFAEYDNLAWIRHVIEQRPEMRWSTTQFPDRPDYYAIGWPK